MILPDVNVLIYAFRPDAADHPKYLAWIEGVVNGDSAYGLSPQVLSAVIRITTNPRAYRQPSTLEEGFAFCKRLIQQPHATLVSPQERHWAIFQSLCETANARGKLVQDAWLAALAIEWGCEWISTDRDFARFKELRWRPPF